MSKIEVLIIQLYIPHYRIKLFNELGKLSYINLTVAHSGIATRSSESYYNEIILKNYKIGPFLYQKNILKIARKHDIVISGNDVRFLHNYLFLILFNKNFKFAFWGHEFGRSTLSLLIRPIRILMAKLVDGFIVYNKEAMENLINWGIPAKSIFIAHNTLYIEQPSINNSAPKDAFIYVGRLQKRKNIEEALFAFKSILNKLPGNICFRIIGQGQAEYKLKKLVKKINIEDRVIFLGAIYNEITLRSYFHKALAFISPGHVGLGVIHSFAYGVPVITKNHSHHAPEFFNITNEGNGILYKGSKFDLACHMKRIALNPELQARMSKKAFDHYKNYCSISNMINGFRSAIDYLDEL